MSYRIEYRRHWWPRWRLLATASCAVEAQHVFERFNRAITLSVLPGWRMRLVDPGGEEIVSVHRWDIPRWRASA